MSWIPDPPIILVLLQNIEKGENLLQNSSELFWRFYLQSMGPEQFKERTEFWINKYLEDSPKGGGFTDPRVRDEIFQGPGKLGELIIDKLDELSTKHFVPYNPDEKEDPIALYIYLHFEASRLVRFLKCEGYSERSRDSLKNAINIFNRCNKAIGNLSNAPWSKEYSVSLYALASLLHVTQFLIQKSDGEYEHALNAIFWGFVFGLLAIEIFPENELENQKAEPFIDLINSVGNIWERAPWMANLDAQEIVNCFEAIRDGRESRDYKNLTNVCSFFINVTKNWWPPTNKKADVKDAKDESWGLSEYWHRALGWAEARLTPSEFKKIIDEREEEWAVNRLKTYFFRSDVWDKLSDRAKSSLTSAERDWFSGSSIRIEAILNELMIAVQELLIQGLWNPLVKWFEENGQERQGYQDFMKLKAEIATKGNVPTILDFETICSRPIVGTYLAEKGISQEDRGWFKHGLREGLYHLRQARNRAEHEHKKWTRADLEQFYDKCLGIGQPGIIRKVCKILFSLKS